MITIDELGRCIARATLEVYSDGFVADDGDFALVSTSRVSGVPVGHLRPWFQEHGIPVLDGLDIGMTQDFLEQLQAHTSMPIEASKPVPSTQNFHVNAGHSSQVQVGHEVSGSQTMVTHHQVLEILAQQIERSPLTPEQKKTALQKLREFTSLPFIGSLLNAGASEAIKTAKDLLGG